jgi:hypothetical protein
MPLPLNL